MAREAARAHRQAGRDPRRPARPEAAASATSRAASSSSSRAASDRADDRGTWRRLRRDAPVSLATGCPRRSDEGRRSTSPTAGSACGCSRSATTRSAARSRSAGRSPRTRALNLPGRRGRRCPRPGREDLAWVDFAIEHEIDLLAVSFVRRAEDLDAGRAADPHRRRRHPGDREDREAAGRRARRGDRQGGDARDHGRPRRPRDRAADRGGARAFRSGCSRSPASYSKPVDHRDPDARLDGRLDRARRAPR